MKFWSEQICWKTSSRICVLRQYITGSSFIERWLTSYTQTFAKNFSRQKGYYSCCSVCFDSNFFLPKKAGDKEWRNAKLVGNDRKGQIVKRSDRQIILETSNCKPFFAAFHSWPKIVLLPWMKYSLTITEIFLFSRHFNAERKPCIS